LSYGLNGEGIPFAEGRSKESRTSLFVLALYEAWSPIGVRAAGVNGGIPKIISLPHQKKNDIIILLPFSIPISKRLQVILVRISLIVNSLVV